MPKNRGAGGGVLNVARSAFAIVLAACALLLSSARSASADDSLILVLGPNPPALMDTLSIVAEGAGFYRDEKLTVTPVHAKSALDALQVCSSGRGDICPIGFEPVVVNYADGIRLKMFLSRASRFGYVIAVPEASPIKTLADFRGKSIGVHLISAAASGVFTTQSALATAGLGPNDYTFTPIGYEDVAASALASGKVAGAAFPFYELIPIMAGGMKLRIFRHPAFADVTNAGFVAAPSVLEGKRDAVKRFSRAIVKASLFIRLNPRASARLFLTAQGKPFSEADVERRTAELTAWQDDLPAADPNSRRIGAVSASALQPYIQQLVDAGVVSKPIPATEVVTEDFITFANDFSHKAVEKRARSMRK
jgi:NitT/TauT family transport system substrate-binding protein